MHPPSRLLRLSAPVELLSLGILLANLAVLHQQAVASAIGPLHGCAYLIAIIATAREVGPDRTATLLAAIPGVGGMLALRRLSAPAQPSSDTCP
ncbi:DUF3817 domain-containing protein [Streptomyces lunaelactis]|uniref:DUF3817 domain-containing protein n=1 Tax=Streptomyces lunaelactis TaxID=1535768 RepID=A0A2R4T668_9ACTN|nr:DUF3817 domain-containing protein [Streptomyces lunaelactis]AVZ74618.1 DUF3817 domain-containing protein [Streptomyces lunaelactis]NUK89859.1 DUF3817 domain-containing protein [Streptomyces lunaelactis]NUL05725.1 DUF3817 domain-containing protein [Streptomyces lunaelactis]